MAMRGGRGGSGGRRGRPGADDKTSFRRRGPVRRKVCRFCADKDSQIDYKDTRGARELHHRARQARAEPHHRQLRANISVN